MPGFFCCLQQVSSADFHTFAEWLGLRASHSAKVWKISGNQEKPINSQRVAWFLFPTDIFCMGWF
jgi:hypothetical protein